MVHLLYLITWSNCFELIFSSFKISNSPRKSLVIEYFPFSSHCHVSIIASIIGSLFPSYILPLIFISSFKGYILKGVDPNSSLKMLIPVILGVQPICKKGPAV